MNGVQLPEAERIWQRRSYYAAPETRRFMEVSTNANCLERYCDARLEVDFQRQAVVLDRKPVRLTKVEFLLLTILAHNAGEIVPRVVLLAQVWGYCREIRTRTLDVHIRRLRRKLKDYGPQHIETIFKVGHRLQPARQPAQHPAPSGALMPVGLEQMAGFAYACD
jgi:DNA-binding response OmpR family regulator